MAALDIGATQYDYGLVTGHGVAPGRPCHALDFDGNKAFVSVIAFAKDYSEGAKTDWALVRFDKFTNPGLIRYEMEPFSSSDPIDKLHVNFALAKALPENHQNCRLEILDFNADERRATYNCRSVAGQSGTPVTRRFEGKDKLVGLHVGQLWMLESPKTGQPDRKGYLNLFNAETIAEIEQLILEN